MKIEDIEKAEKLRRELVDAKDALHEKYNVMEVLNSDNKCNDDCVRICKNGGSCTIWGLTRMELMQVAKVLKTTVSRQINSLEHEIEELEHEIENL